MMLGGGRLYPPVSRASPGRPPSLGHSARSSDPAARWIPPSTPPPASDEVFAAFMIASTRKRVMSPEDKRMHAAMQKNGHSPTEWKISKRFHRVSGDAAGG